MRNRLIAGNWKMNMSRQETASFLTDFNRLYCPVDGVEVAIFPPYVWLDMVAQACPAGVAIGAQNLYPQSQGAFTGEISTAMLQDVGCQYVIIGHSERRQLMGETDQMVHKKTQQALVSGLQPLVCVGESEQQRKSGQAKETVFAQLQSALAGIDFQPGQVIIAYEPVWAIGTGNTASSADAQEMAAFLRYSLRDMFGDELARQTRILYGGSVTPDNATALLSELDIDGALVGGASLDPIKFYSIVASGRGQ